MDSSVVMSVNSDALRLSKVFVTSLHNYVIIHHAYWIFFFQLYMRQLKYLRDASLTRLTLILNAIILINVLFLKQLCICYYNTYDNVGLVSNGSMCYLS